MPIAHRVRQTLAALTSRPEATCRELVARHLTPAQAGAFDELSTHDLAHLCRFCARIMERNPASPDLVAAALLHDIGKVSDRGRVYLTDRIAKVVLAKISPAHLTRLASRPAPRLLEGLSLAVHHPTVGATRASQLVCSERACWLIAHHEDEPPFGDQELCLLVAVDNETV